MSPANNTLPIRIQVMTAWERGRPFDGFQSIRRGQMLPDICPAPATRLLAAAGKDEADGVSDMGAQAGIAQRHRRKILSARSDVAKPKQQLLACTVAQCLLNEHILNVSSIKEVLLLQPLRSWDSSSCRTGRPMIPACIQQLTGLTKAIGELDG